MVKAGVSVVFVIACIVFIGAAFIQWEYNYIVPKVASGLTVATVNSVTSDGTVVIGPPMIRPTIEYKTVLCYMLIGLAGGICIMIIYIFGMSAGGWAITKQ